MAVRLCGSALVSALMTGGCTSPPPIEGPVSLGQIAAVSGPRVRPDRVIEDSRCPRDVQCIQAGRLIVRVTIFGGGWSREMDLTLGMPVPVADGSLTLVDAVPASADQPRRYRFTFRFQGGL